MFPTSHLHSHRVTATFPDGSTTVRLITAASEQAAEDHVRRRYPDAVSVEAERTWSGKDDGVPAPTTTPRKRQSRGTAHGFS